MPESRRSVYTGSPWEEKVAYCRAKRIGNVVVVSGTVGLGEDGEAVAPGDVFLQTLAAWRRIEAALTELGAARRHVVRTRAYLTDIGSFEDFARAHREIFAGIDPVSTAVEVARLVAPEFVVELEVDAIVDD